MVGCARAALAPERNKILLIMLERRNEPDGGLTLMLRLGPEELQRADLIEAHLATLVEILRSAPVKAAVPEEPPGVVLKSLRRDAGLTQTELAKLANTTQSRISDMESGTRPFTTDAAKRLAQYFQVPENWFLRKHSLR